MCFAHVLLAWACVTAQLAESRSSLAITNRDVEPSFRHVSLRRGNLSQKGHEKRRAVSSFALLLYGARLARARFTQHLVTKSLPLGFVPTCGTKCRELSISSESRFAFV